MRGGMGFRRALRGRGEGIEECGDGEEGWMDDFGVVVREIRRGKCVQKVMGANI